MDVPKLDLLFDHPNGTSARIEKTRNMNLFESITSVDVFFLILMSSCCLFTRSFLTIVDDFSRATWVYLLRSKDEVYDRVYIFFNILLNQFEIKVKTIDLTMELNF